MFGFSFTRRTCDSCGKEFKGEGLYLPSRRRIFCSQKCAGEYVEELERKGELRLKTDGPIYDLGGCC